MESNDKGKKKRLSFIDKSQVRSKEGEPGSGVVDSDMTENEQRL